MKNDVADQRRILIPIDLHGVNRGTLEILVRIARQLNRGLLGLLLEDTRLQRVADLPFTTEITLTSGRERSLLRDHLSQRHSRVTADTQRALSELALRNEVQLSYEEAAGARWHTALERDDQLDIFFPARRLWHVPSQSRPGQLPPGLGGANLRIGLVLARTGQDQAALDTAGMIQQAGLGGDVYVLTEWSPAPHQLQTLYRPHCRVSVQSNLHCSPEMIIRLVRQSPYDLLLLPHDCLLGIPAEQLDAALDKSGAQVLVIN